MGFIMTITQMKFFLETAKQLNFTLAADRLYTTQPTLSRQIMNMEQELGVQLFIRSNNTVWLTPAGRELYDGLEKLCNDYDSICARVENADRGVAGELRLAILEDQLFNDSIVRAIDCFQREYPKVVFKVRRGDFKTIHAGILNGEYDITISFRHNEDFDTRIGIADVEDEPMYLAVPKKYKLPGIDYIRKGAIPPELYKVPFLMLSPNCFDQNAALPAQSWVHEFWKLLDEKGGRIYIDSVSALPVYVSLGLGMTMVNHTSILGIDPNVSLIPVEEASSVEKVMCYNKTNKAPIVDKFLKIYLSEKESEGLTLTTKEGILS